MSRSDRLKEKHGQSNSVDCYDEESAARTRPFSFEDIMLRRGKKELLENVKDPAKEPWNISYGGSEKISDHFDESVSIYKHDKSSSPGMEKQVLKEVVKLSSGKKVEGTYIKEDNSTGGKDRENYNFQTRSSGGLSNIGRITKESRTGKDMHGRRRNEDNSENEAEHKHSRDSVNKDRYAETKKPKSERKIKKNQTVDDENPVEYHTERKHDKGRHDSGKRKKWSSNYSEEVTVKKNHIDSADKDRHALGRGKYEREVKRKYKSGDDKTQGRNASREKNLVKHQNLGTCKRKEKREKVRSHHEESKTKRRRSRSREHEERRSLSFSPRAQKHSYHNGERKELSMLSQKDSSRKKHSDNDRSRVTTNGLSGGHHRHGGSTSGLGGYSPRKRKSEAAAKTPSPSKHSLQKKQAGWDLPPEGTNDPASAIVSSSFQLSNHTVISNQHDVAKANYMDPVIVKPLPVSFMNDVSIGKNANIDDSVQLTQATRPMRRLYLENLPASASEKDVMDCLNNLLLSAGVIHMQQAQPCISCILHKDKGQALVEFLTAEDASATLSFDGSIIFGSIVKIRRPKDFVEVATGEPNRSEDAAVTLSDVVVDSPDKIFIGGISDCLSSDMLLEIAGAFGSLKAYHFVAEATDRSCAFLEYLDHSVTIKACTGLNGMRLAGEVLTVVQAMPDASPLPSDVGGKSPSYGIPEHAKPLLRKATQVLKIKDVLTLESVSSLSDMEMEEILEDVRLECTRFGIVKSVNVVKHSHSRDVNLSTKSEECEVRNNVDLKDASQDTLLVIDNAETSYSEKVTDPKSKGRSEVEPHYEKELEVDKADDDCSVSVDEHADGDFHNKSCQGEQLVNDTTVEDLDNKSIPNSIIKGCPDHQDTPKDGPELHDKTVANDIGAVVENKMEASHIDSNNTVSTFKEGFSERRTSSGAVSVGASKGINEEDDNYDHVFEPGSVLVEYGRTEACCSAAHCLHGRLFDGRKVTVEYVPLSLYRARFTK